MIAIPVRNNHFSNPHCCGNLISAHFVLDNLSKSHGRYTCRFDHRIGYWSKALGTVYGHTYSEFFTSGNFPMWYLLVMCNGFLNDTFTFLRIAESFSGPVYISRSWQCLRHCQENPSRIWILDPYIPLLWPLGLEDETNNLLSRLPLCPKGQTVKQKCRKSTISFLITSVSGILANAEHNLDWGIHSIPTE